MITLVDDLLNKVTMYRLVLYVLAALLVVAGFFGFIGVLSISPGDLAFSTAILIGASWLANELFAKGFGAATNVESVYITALILALIMAPVAPTHYAGVAVLVITAAWAMASKYIFALGKKHLFNPAAFGVVFSAFVLGVPATWWIGGNVALLPFVLVGGLLIVRKIRRFDLAITFTLVALVVSVLTSNSTALSSVTLSLLHSPLFFFAGVMLIEPLTIPSDRWHRVIYGALVGLLFAPNIHLGSFYTTPELALLIGNLYAYLVSPKGRFMLELVGREQLSDNTYEFRFASDGPIPFKPGQYIEWTLPHDNPDNRGNRRYFTISTAPNDPIVGVGVKFYDPSSSFKRGLAHMQPHQTISVSHIAGDFTLPRDESHKLAFIAGGIGITPFASMTRHMLAEKKAPPTVLLYANRTKTDIAYKELFDRARAELGMKTIYALSNEPAPPADAYAGTIDADLIRREIPDFAERMFYISGPHGMVDSFKHALRDMGVPLHRIKIDFFPGYA